MSRNDRIRRQDDRAPRRGRRERPPGAVWGAEAERRPRRGPRPAITREEIVEAGLAVADAEGLGALSMRRVAQDLGVGTMTLYTHVVNKEELLDLMQDAVMGELLVPGDVPGDWRAALTEIAVRTTRTFVAHAWIASDMSRRPLPGPNTLMHVEQSLAAVAPLALDDATASALLAIVDDYAIGYALRTSASRRWRWEGDAGPTAAMMGDPPEYLMRLLHSGDFPRLSAAAAKQGFTPPSEDRFEVGLDWLLDGVAAALAGGR